MKRTKEEALKTRQIILQSALDLFYQKGYSKTTFDEIASRIELTKGAVYWHFKNKPDLVAALINDYIAKKNQFLKQKDLALNQFKDIEAYFLATADFILGDENALKLAFFLSLQMEWSETIITKVMEKIGQNKKFIFLYLKDSLVLMQKNGEIREDIDTDILSSLIINLWTGNLEAYLSKRCSVDLKVMIKKSFDLLFNGLKGKE
ncbi:MAG: TetR family transcriptional regulator [Alphaproteobacteria bacterium]|nr:TetR family transcriptional regulator [Alphaproteobacteria bacterium]